MTNILILGAGFGGINAALKLSRLLRNRGSSIPWESGEKKLGGDSGFKITLLDRNNFHLFIPSLYEVATIYGLIEDNFNKYLRGSVAIPVGEILKGKKVNFVQAEIKEINLKDKVVITGGGAKLDFDYLVIALGGETEFYDIPGTREYAYNLKSVDDAVAIYKKIKDLYKTDRADKAYKIAIIGGGFTGVELAAELGCCVGKIIEEHKLSRTCTTISLFQADPKILPAVSEEARKIIEKRLKDEMVQIHINSPVKEVGPDYIKIGDRGEALNFDPVYQHPKAASLQPKSEGSSDVVLRGFDMVLWAGGIRGLKLLESLNLKLAQKNTIKINEFLQTKNSDDTTNEKIFAIGDSAGLIDPKNGRPVPAMAYIAHDQADIVAENIINHIKNRKLKPYKPFYDVWIAPVGGKWAYFYYKGIGIAGFTGYLLRQLVDFKYFLRILPLSKALALFFKDLVIFTKND